MAHIAQRSVERAMGGKKKKRRSVRQYEKKMDIDLSTGDFLLQVGGLIRIDSLNNSDFLLNLTKKLLIINIKTSKIKGV